MAKAAATTDTIGKAPARGPSMIIQLVVLLALTGVAAGIGLFSGNYLNGGSAAPAHGSAAADHKPAAGHEVDPAEEEAKRGLVALPAITTNLAAPAETWVRIELSAVFEAEPDPKLADLVHQDLLAFLRTVKLHQVEGASGFQHLKSDMEERARIRSDGKIKALLIKTLLFE